MFHLTFTMMHGSTKLKLCRGLTDGNPCLKDQFEDLKHVGKVTFLENIKSVNIRNWEKLAQNRDSWKKVFEQARTLYRL